MLVAAIRIRATHEDNVGLDSRERLERLRELCAELMTFNETTIDGWTITVESAIEARCVYERAMLWEPGERPKNERCPETATEVVGGSPYCGSHAKGAHRLMDALGRAS